MAQAHCAASVPQELMAQFIAPKGWFLVSAPSVDLANLPEIMRPAQYGAAVNKSVDQLAYERSSGKGPPFVRYGRSVYYLRSDVLSFLQANRHAPGLAAIQANFEKQVDPEGVLSQAERTKLARNAQQAQLAKARLASSRKRRRTKDIGAPVPGADEALAGEDTGAVTR
jgi:hypothetical protein